jgi:hypothetical protein
MFSLKAGTRPSYCLRYLSPDDVDEIHFFGSLGTRLLREATI